VRELEAEIHCPECHASYGQVFRVQYDNGWRNEPEPNPIPKYCSVCECPTVRKPA